MGYILLILFLFIALLGWAGCYLAYFQNPPTSKELTFAQKRLMVLYKNRKDMPYSVATWRLAFYFDKFVKEVLNSFKFR